jgi:hypothetical protein
VVDVSAEVMQTIERVVVCILQSSSPKRRRNDLRDKLLPAVQRYIIFVISNFTVEEILILPCGYTCGIFVQNPGVDSTDV